MVLFFPGASPDCSALSSNWQRWPARACFPRISCRRSKTKVGVGPFSYCALSTRKASCRASFRNGITTKCTSVFGRARRRWLATGPAGKALAYGGGHTFALTRVGREKPEALKLLIHLTAFEQQMFEARQGCVPVRRSVMQKMKGEADATNRARLEMLEAVISEHILIPPKFARYPEVEEVLWRTVQRAILNEITIDDALRHMTEQISRIVQWE